MKNTVTEESGGANQASTTVSQTKRRGRPINPLAVKAVYLNDKGFPMGKGRRRQGLTFNVVYIHRKEQFIPGVTNIVRSESVTIPIKPKKVKKVVEQTQPEAETVAA